MGSHRQDTAELKCASVWLSEHIRGRTFLRPMSLFLLFPAVSSSSSYSSRCIEGTNLLLALQQTNYSTLLSCIFKCFPQACPSVSRANSTSLLNYRGEAGKLKLPGSADCRNLPDFTTHPLVAT